MKRVEWVDGAKGLAIFAVVVLHVLRGVSNAGFGEIPAQDVVDGFCGTFSLPVFFFISGWFAVASLAKYGGPGLLLNKMRTLYYPYIIWQTIQIGIMLLVGSSQTNASVTPWNLLLTPIVPLFQFWFFMTLLACFFFFVLMKTTLKGDGNLLIIAALMMPVVFGWALQWQPIEGLINYFIYFALGIFVGGKPTTRFATGPWPWVIGIIGTIGVWASVVGDFGYGSRLVVIGACIGIAATVSIARLLARSSATRWVEVIGVYSLEIYVMHVIFAAGTRIALGKILGIDNPWIHLIAGVTVGTIAPIFVGMLARRYRLPLFQWPSGKKRVNNPMMKSGTSVAGA